MVFRFLLAMVVMLGLVAPAQAKRIALVIGNAEYTELAGLQKTLGDAGGYRDALSELGFDVTYRIDLDFFNTARVVGNFVGRIQPGDEVAFVFAGHGWSDGRTNYLLPTNTPKRGTSAELAQLSLPLKNGANGILDQITARGATLNFSVIDACRDNPFVQADGTRSAGLARGGLSGILAAQGSFVVYSAGAGQTALDRLSNSDQSPYSVFSRIFIPKLRSGLSLEQAADETQLEVSRLAASIGHAQAPAYYDQALGPTFLRASATNLSRIAVTPNTAPVTPTQTTVLAVNAAKEAYNVAKAIGTQSAFERVIARFAGTIWAEFAKDEIAKLPPAPVPTPAPQISALPSDPCRDFAGTPPLNAECVVENGRATWFAKGPTPAELERQRQQVAPLQSDRQTAKAVDIFKGIGVVSARLSPQGQQAVHALITQAMNSSPTNQPVRWADPVRSRIYGTVTPTTPAYYVWINSAGYISPTPVLPQYSQPQAIAIRSAAGYPSECRDYQTSTFFDGQPETMAGRMCRSGPNQPWKLANSGYVGPE